MPASNYLKEVAYAKLNLNFKVLKKLPSSFHEVDSFVTFLPKLYDILLIKKSSKNKIYIKGKQSLSLLQQGGDTLISKSINKLSDYLKKPINLEIILYKNIPLGSGLGGGSANAAAIIRAILKLYNLKKLENTKILNEIGSDVPVCFFSINAQVTGIGEKIMPVKSIKKKLWVLLIKPDVLSDTKNVFSHFSGPYSEKSNFNFDLNSLIDDMNNNNNSLESTVCNLENKIKLLILNLPYLTNITKPRITGSGSTVFLLFKEKEEMETYKNNVKKITKNYWVLSTYILL